MSEAPVFKAVSHSARQLYQLLNCIRFADKAHVSIGSEGIRIAVEDSRAMQGVVFLDKAIFTSYMFPALSVDEDGVSELPPFQVSLTALLEVLQIFGAADAGSSRNIGAGTADYSSNIRPQRVHAFSTSALGISGLCRMSYTAVGAPLSIVLEEAGVTTTCNLHTYEADQIWEIPLDRDAIKIKIIMSARWLFDAIQELSSLGSPRIDITASPRAPYLGFSSTGSLGSAAVDFARGRELLETFAVDGKWSQGYKHDMVKAASEAMRLAVKVSIRGDDQGVLSLQFMIEVEGGHVSFVDFRFVPFVPEDEESEGDGEYDGEEGGTSLVSDGESLFVA